MDRQRNAADRPTGRAPAAETVSRQAFGARDVRPGPGSLHGLIQAMRAGGVIQRDYDDTARAAVTRNALSAVWTKIKKNAVGKEDFPNFDGISAHLNGLLAQEMTERELVEAVSQTPEIRAILLKPRTKSLGDAPLPNTKAAVIGRVIDATMYYHASLQENVPDLFADGLRAKKGGKGGGVSSFGRADGDAAAKATYNKWSQGHVFISALKSEAEGYRDKMAQNSGKPAKIIHVFANTDWVNEEFKVDVDSKAGLKLNDNILGVGDGTNLNDRAASTLSSGMAAANYTAVTKSELEPVYRNKV